MSDEAEKKVDWAFQSVIAGLCALIVAVAGYYCHRMDNMLGDLRAEQSALRDKQHSLELGITERKANAFTAQNGLEAWKAIRDNTQEIGEVKSQSAKQTAEIKLLLERIEARFLRES